MNAGELLLVTKDVVGLLESKGILLPDGAFDQTKLDEVSEDLAFAGAIEAILKQRGLDVPEKVDKIISILPLVAGLLE